MESSRSEFSLEVTDVNQTKATVETWLKSHRFKSAELDTEPVFLRKKFPHYQFYFDYATELNTIYLYAWLRLNDQDFPIDSPDLEKITHPIRKPLQNLLDTLENL